METSMGFQSPATFVLPAGRGTRRSSGPAARSASQADSNFLATLLAMAGHDLRQPLQVITSAHDVLAETPLSDEQQQELMRAEDATTRLATMLRQLIEALELRYRSDDDLQVAVPLRSILEGISREFAESARLKGITFLMTATNAVALSHPVLLAGMLRNLIRNAIDYTPFGGGVFVTSRRCERDLRIEVRDTGVGIRATALSTMFRAFQRADNSRSDGLGLGLFIVQQAANLLGHRVEVASVDGRGSRFSIIIPAAESCVPAIRQHGARPRRSAKC